MKSPLSHEVTEAISDDEPVEQDIDKTLEDIDLKQIDFFSSNKLNIVVNLQTDKLINEKES